MSKKEAYKQKIEAEVEVAQAKLTELKAQAKSVTADARIKYDKQIDEFQQAVDTTKIKLEELGEASEDAWEHLKDNIDSTWSEISASIRKAMPPFP